MNKFDLVFKDADWCDWHITLHTSESKTSEEIEDLILTYAEIVSNGIKGDNYSPVDIMDRLCDDMQSDGREWYWTDTDDVIELDEW